MPPQVPDRAANGAVGQLGAAVLLVGGLLEAARLVVFSFVSLVLPQAVGAVIYGVPSTCIGVGLIVLGSTYPARGRVALVVAGALDLVTVAVNLTQIALNSPLGPAPSFLATLLAFASTVAAAIVLLTDRSLTGPPRWALALPALAVVLVLVTIYAPVPAAFDRANVLLPFGYAAAGTLLLRYATARTGESRPE